MVKVALVTLILGFAHVNEGLTVWLAQFASVKFDN